MERVIDLVTLTVDFPDLLRSLLELAAAAFKIYQAVQKSFVFNDMKLQVGAPRLLIQAFSYE
jgi:hypothetical protein